MLFKNTHAFLHLLVIYLFIFVPLSNLLEHRIFFTTQDDDNFLISDEAEQPTFMSLFSFTHHWSFRQIVMIRKVILVLVNYRRMNYVRLEGMK